jgi:hypothetical protein
MAINLDFVKARLGDEIGFAAEDLGRLYGQPSEEETDAHLGSLETNENAIVDHVLSDIENVRQEHRVLAVNAEHSESIRGLLNKYHFHPLVSQFDASGGVGWKLSGDDAQYVAYRAADIVNMDFDWSDVLRIRLNRLILSHQTEPPEIDQAFRDHVADVTFYLIELTGII